MLMSRLRKKKEERIKGFKDKCPTVIKHKNRGGFATH
jgi:hypothetical protein